MSSRLGLIVGVTVVLAAVLFLANRFGSEQDMVARLRAHPPYVPKSYQLVRVDCGGTSREGFRMKLPCNFSFKIDIPRASVVLSFALCNLTDRDVRLRVLAGPGEKRSATLLQAPESIASGSWQSMRIPLGGIPPGSARLFFEARGEGSGDVAWSAVRIEPE
ncbi:MAG: hypothetical protein AB1714_24340 [Acidobacteriota bacterium]